MSNVKGNKSNVLTPSVKKTLVEEHFKEELTFRELSLKYNISYSATRNICLNYELLGEESLFKKSGAKKGTNKVSSRSSDPKNREIAALKKSLAYKDMEICLLKKLNELPD